MNSKWMLYTKRAEFERISARFNISPVLSRIIINRGVEEPEFEKYLDADMAMMHSPQLMCGMREAAEIIFGEIDKCTRVRIVGDYDIDGVCASYILWKGLNTLGAAADVKIPDRIKDGYGINEEIIKEAKRDGISLIITCDNGIAAHKEMELAAELGMKVIITDHHEIYKEENRDVLPEVCAVINPKRIDCGYPFKDICGALIAYKLIEFLYYRQDSENSKKIYESKEFSEFLEIAAIATVGDVMPLRDENRTVVKNGLKRLINTENKGLRALIKATGMEGKSLSAYHIGFVLGPCLNAGGRLENALIALNMLKAETLEEAQSLALHLKELNDERKSLTLENVKKAVDIVEKKFAHDDILIVYLRNCHESVAGIIAGRVREYFGKPAIILTDAAGEEGVVKGSARSIENYHMFKELTKVEDLFIKFGGHAQAAGMSLLKENIEEFRQRMNKNSRLCKDDFVRKIWIDVALPFSYLSMNFVKELGRLEPFGNGNEKPKFARKDIDIISKRIMGRDRNVVKMILKDTDGCRMDAVYFGDGEAFLDDTAGSSKIDIIYYPEINEYCGRKSLQITIIEYKRPPH